MIPIVDIAKQRVRKFPPRFRLRGGAYQNGTTMKSITASGERRSTSVGVVTGRASISVGSVGSLRPV
jgi:hypothetical protein